jgi:XTP/dITP diphosphohydrolase
MQLYFATSNSNKFEEAKRILNSVELKQFEFNHREIRSDSLEEIATQAVEAAYSQIKKPVIVEDAGLFIDALNGFPGTYSGWVEKKIGFAGILKLMDGIDKRSAQFRAVIAYYDGTSIKTFGGICQGEIANKAEGGSGFGYDPIFIPGGHSQTFAQSIELKNKLSHRYNSLLELSKFLNREVITR